jgi:hypothetical protein
MSSKTPVHTYSPEYKSTETCEVGQYEVPGENAEDFGSLMQARHLVCIIGVGF